MNIKKYRIKLYVYILKTNIKLKEISLYLVPDFFHFFLFNKKLENSRLTTLTNTFQHFLGFSIFFICF